MNPLFKLTAGALLVALAASSPALAVSITGAINFNGTPTVDTPAAFSTSTRITAFTDLSVGAIHMGAYSAIPTGTGTVSWVTPLIYNAPVLPATDLWSVTFAGVTYSFKAATIMSAFNATTNTWSVAGNGIANISAGGYDPTPGNYNLTVTSSGTSSFSFAATTAVTPVPEGGSTAIWLGAGLLALGFISRGVRSNRLKVG